ncbi:hypothetical protein CDAR_202171 [Caerostris darwini]|uniref:Engrailed n=1 Tax=Caerostris darwini TaxID=1538125 RepID=A0AAV4RI58_9ARAC|nr:hypothetical protein CDAR_202171 [Caerostris darwini]
MEPSEKSKVPDKRVFNPPPILSEALDLSSHLIYPRTQIPERKSDPDRYPDPSQHLLTESARFFPKINTTNEYDGR